MIDSKSIPIALKRSTIIIGTTAAPNDMLSRSGRPESLSISGNMPETLHNPPARRQVDIGK